MPFAKGLFKKRHFSLSIKISIIFTVYFFFSAVLVSFIIISLLKANILQKKIELFLSDSKVIYRAVSRVMNTSDFHQLMRDISHGDDTPEDVSREKINMLSDLFERTLRATNTIRFISYVVYFEDKAMLSRPFVFVSNDPFIPLLPLTHDPPYDFYSEKNYYTDADLHIIYKAIQMNGIIVQTSMSFDSDNLDALINRLPYIVMLVSLPILFFSFLSSLFLAKKFLQPIAQIANTAKEISSTNLDKRLIELPTNDEVQNLARTFNDLFERLQNDFERERRFTGDVSHELKTPLAVLLGHANLLRRWGKNDPAVLEKSINIIHEEANAMQNLISKLLLLARTENTKKDEKEHFAVLNLNTILQEVKQKTLMIHPEIDFTVTCDANSEVYTHKDDLIQVLRIFIENSVVYSENPAKICIEWNADKKKLSIQDSGYGISEKDLPHVFKRFYRADESRNRQGKHAGLGLPIAKAILENLKYEFKIETSTDAKDHGTRITIAIA
ncbi:MAG: ATP-binding protein [Treponemataceae bacterium]